MKLILLCYSVSLLALTSANAASVLVQNLNESGTAAHSIFDASGNLLPAVPIGNVRLGAFAAGFDAQSAWNNGDIDTLNSNFTQFGNTSNILLDTGVDGLLQSFFSSADTSLADLPIVLWITQSNAFLNPHNQHLIFRFNALFSASLNSNQVLSLSYGAGQVIAGGYGNFSHDYGFGGGALPGYNLDPVIPEPATYALIATALAGAVALRWRKVR